MKNLIKTLPQIAHRARAYKLSDDGASDQAQARRAAKNKKAFYGDDGEIEFHRRMIASIENRQASDRAAPAHVAAGWIAHHEKQIRALESDANHLKPAVRVVPPISRRVRREDRKREKQDRKKAGK